MQSDTTILEAVKGFHDSAISGIQNGETQIATFAGMSISPKGLAFSAYKNVAGKIAIFSKEKNEAEDAFPHNAIILQKNYAINVFKELDHFMFRYINDNGETYGQVPKEVTLIRDKYSRGEAFGFLLFAGVMGAIFSIIAGIVLSLFYWLLLLPSIGTFFLAFHFGDRGDEKIAEHIQKFYANLNHHVLLKKCFPDNTDYKEERWNGNAKMSVTFPDTSKVHDKLQSVLKYCAKIPHSKPLIIAYESAIGLKVDYRNVLESFNHDPMIALETENFITIFPDTRWGDVAEEQQMLDKLQKIFEAKGYALFN